MHFTKVHKSEMKVLKAIIEQMKLFQEGMDGNKRKLVHITHEILNNYNYF